MDELRCWNSHCTKCEIDFDYQREVGPDGKTETCDKEKSRGMSHTRFLFLRLILFIIDYIDNIEDILQQYENDKHIN